MIYAPAVLLSLATGSLAQYAPPQEQHYGQYAAAPQEQQYGQYAAAPQEQQHYGQYAAPQEQQNGYGTPQPQYQPPAYAPTEAAYDPKADWDQFWANSHLCKAEFDLNKCLLDCRGPKHFFDGSRISNCIVQFVSGLCSDISTKKIPACENGRVSITTDNCQTSAYADALLVMDRMSSNLDSNLLGSLKPHTWPFTAVQLALDVTIERADCVIDAFFYYVSQCSKNNYLDKEDVQCVEEHLKHGGCEEESQDSFDRVHLEALADSEEESYVHKYYGDDGVEEALSELAENYLNSGLEQLQVNFNAHTGKASLEVCPVNYLWMNYGYEEFGGLEGIPETCVAFHFPRDAPEFKPLKFEDDSKPSHSTHHRYGANLLQENDSPVDSASEEHVLDPWTPKNGIQKTCHKHYEFSKALYILAGHDIGNVCYTIDGYSIKFLESGKVEPLHSEWIHQKFRHRHGRRGKGERDLLEEGEIDHNESIEERESAVDVPDHHASCHTASWRNQKTCVSHLTEWQMHVRCCKSYAQAKAEAAPKVYVTQPPLYKLPPQQPYYPQQPQYNTQPTYEQQAPAYVQPAPTYEQQAPASNYATLLEDNYENPTYAQQAPAYEQQPTYQQQAPTYEQQHQAPAYDQQYEQPAYAQPTYAAQPSAYDTYSPSVYEYTHTVYSNADNGTLEEYPRRGHHGGKGRRGRRGRRGVYLHNGDLAEKYEEWAEELLEKKVEAEAVTQNTTEYLTVLKSLYYQKHAEVANYSHTFDLPTVSSSRKGYYVGNDLHSKNTCERLKIDIDFEQVIPLVVGHCYPQSCLLSQYVSCIENPVDDYKRFRATYPKAAAPVYYGQPQAAPTPTYRSLMSAEKSSVMSLASIGFVAGVVVVALIQFVSAGSRPTQALI